MAQPRFKLGDKVQHPEDPADRFTAGTGTVTKVYPETKWGGYGYEVKCDTTGEVLPVTFEEKDLAAA